MQAEAQATRHPTIPDVLTLTPDIYTDHRGTFTEMWRAATLGMGGLPLIAKDEWDDEPISIKPGSVTYVSNLSQTHIVRHLPTFVAGNLSVSAPWTVRGLHYQLREPQGKLISVPKGAIFDVAVDLRPKSPTFGKWAGQYLDDKLHKSSWIPPGFAHGFMALSEGATVQYQCTTYYDEESSRSIYPFSIDIAWPVRSYATLMSAKDRSAPYWEAARQEIMDLDAR